MDANCFIKEWTDAQDNINIDEILKRSALSKSFDSINRVGIIRAGVMGQGMARRVPQMVLKSL